MSGSQHKPESFAKGFLKFTGFSALAGLLGVALLAPTALVSGIAASAGITIFENLPDYIKPINASQSSTLYATKDGKPSPPMLPAVAGLNASIADTAGSRMAR